jgi:hypothetical protein
LLLSACFGNLLERRWGLLCARLLGEQKHRPLLGRGPLQRWFWLKIGRQGIRLGIGVFEVSLPDEGCYNDL